MREQPGRTFLEYHDARGRVRYVDVELLAFHNAYLAEAQATSQESGARAWRSCFWSIVLFCVGAHFAIWPLFWLSAWLLAAAWWNREACHFWRAVADTPRVS